MVEVSNLAHQERRQSKTQLNQSVRKAGQHCSLGRLKKIHGNTTQALTSCKDGGQEEKTTWLDGLCHYKHICQNGRN